MSEKNLQTKTVIEAALRRIGICPSSKIVECIEKLSTSNYADMENFMVAKILFSKETTCKCEKYCRINLDYARMFILNRMLKYISEKNASRMFFDSFQLQDNIDLINAMNEKLGPEETMEIIKKIGPKDL
jgi:hypothetical protein